MSGFDIESFIKELRKNRAKHKRKWQPSISKKDRLNRINIKHHKFRPDIVTIKRKHCGINRRRLNFDAPDDFNESDC